MTRRDKLTILQGILIGLQTVNASLAMTHGVFYVTVTVAALASAGQYIAHNMSLDTPVPGQVIEPPKP